MIQAQSKYEDIRMGDILSLKYEKQNKEVFSNFFLK